MNTLLWVAGTLLIPVGVGLALALLTWNLPGGIWLRLPFLIPYAISGIGVGVIWSFILSANGALDQALAVIGITDPPRWLVDAPLNTFVMIIAASWQGVGVNALLFTIGLQSIPKEPLEAARVDGATGAASVRQHPLADAPSAHRGRGRPLDRRQPEDLRHRALDDEGRPRTGIRDARAHDVPRDVRQQRLRARLCDRRLPFGRHADRVGALPSPAALPEARDVTMSRILRTATLVILGLFWLLPVYLLVVNASKSPVDLHVDRGVDPVRRLRAVLEHRRRDAALGLSDSIVATLIYAFVSPIIAVLVGAAAGFAIVALRLKRGFLWFVVIFGGTVFPLQMVLLPLFDAYSRVGLYDTHVGMIIVYTAISIPFSAFVMRNFFTGVAHSVFEAAVLDGATTWRIFTAGLPADGLERARGDLHPAGDVHLERPAARPHAHPVRRRPADRDDPRRNAEHLRRRADVDRPRGGRARLAADGVLFLFTQKFFARGLALGQY